jgi:eukaryotic-like serine/threonine-protein kinase
VESCLRDGAAHAGKCAVEPALEDGTAGASCLDVVAAREAAEVEKEGHRVGETLREKWHLDALLGVGGMATVYAATHRNGARGAVKILRANEGAEVKRRFLREGYIANRVDHPGAVRVFDDDVAEDGSAFLVMELLDGMPLDVCASTQGGKLLPQQVILVCHDLLDVLAAAHEKGIVHRDIKPENIFLTGEGCIKVLDFGIARLLEKGGVRRTQDGRAMGTPGFMAPEQSRGRWDLVGAASDLWSVGATMFTLLSAQVVHLGDTPQEVIAASFMRPARKIRDVVPDTPSALAEVIDKALELPMADRWATAREMQAALDDAYKEIFGHPMPSRHMPQVVRDRRSDTSSSDRIDTLAVSHPSPTLSRSSLQTASVSIARSGRSSPYRRMGIVALLGALAMAAATHWRGHPASVMANASAPTFDQKATALSQETPDIAASSLPGDEPAAMEAPLVRQPSRVPAVNKHPLTSTSARPDVYDRRY